MFTKKTIHDIDVQGRRVLIRADYNVPVDDQGNITNDYRLTQSVPTLKALLDKGASLVIMSHMGRPEGPGDPKCTLRPVAQRLSELLSLDVQFATDCIGEPAERAADVLRPGQVLLLENLRYHEEEEKNDDAFAQQLAKLGEVFVQDGFGVVHRAHASTDAVTRHLPSVAGLLLEREVDTITNVMEAPERPLMAIIGGAKIADKIEVLNRFIEIADFIAVGGAMANTFLAAKGIEVGKSKYDKDELPLAREIMEKAAERAKRERFVFYLPQDGVVATKLDKDASLRIVDWDAHVIAQLESYPKTPSKQSGEVAEDEMILDIDPSVAHLLPAACNCPVHLYGTARWA